MHCHSCKLLIEGVLREQPGVKDATVDLRNEIVEVSAGGNESATELAARMTAAMAPNGYRFSTEPGQTERTGVPLNAVALGVPILGAFLVLQRSGVLSFGFGGALTPATALFVGGVASLSTCLAVVGGLVLSLSAQVSADVSTVRPFVLFHAGRLAGFIALGAVLGGIGGAITIHPSVPALLGLLVSVLMVMIGLGLLGVRHGGMQALPITLPRGLYDRLTSFERGTFAPIVVGVGTFFLPCGFTQSMQLAALTTGSAYQAGIIMGMFALGTLPMLAALSFGSFRMVHSQYAPLFLPTVGVVVVGLGIVTLLTGLVGLGIIPPIFNV